MEFCIKCGQQINEGDVFCPNCGAKIEKNNSHQIHFQDQTKNTTHHFTQNNRSGFMNKFIKQNDFDGLIACAVIFISNFLPFASASAFGYSRSVSLMDDGKDGIIFLVLSIVTAVLIYMKKDTVALIAGIITGGLGIYEIMNTNSQLGAYASYVTKEAGYYLLLIGSIALLISVIVKKFVIK